MLRLAKFLFFLLIVSLPFMKHAVAVGGHAATATDVLFLATAACLAVAVARGETRLRWNGIYVVLIAYFAAMLASALVSADPARAAVKLATQAYLLALPVLAFSLIESREDLRKALMWWLAATAVTAGIGTLAVLLFFVADWPLAYALHSFGTLPPGPYPRLESTFVYPAMLTNYLTVSLMILLIARRLGWIGPPLFLLLLAPLLVTAAFSLTPGLGGIFLAIGLWLFASERRDSPRFAQLGLAGGAMAALLFILAASVTPILHATAPFLIQSPGLGQELAPSVRLMTWIDAIARFLAHPLLGVGIGSDAVAVLYADPSGNLHQLTDAHNVFLNVAVQCGVIGVAAMVWLIVRVAKLTGKLRLDRGNVVRLGLGLAWLNAFAYQGLTGSYEDARHLWVLLGLLFASVNLEKAEEKSL